jgi:hypothetical protein
LPPRGLSLKVDLEHSVENRLIFQFGADVSYPVSARSALANAL